MSKNIQTSPGQIRSQITESDQSRKAKGVKSLLEACQLKNVEHLKTTESKNNKPSALQQDIT